MIPSRFKPGIVVLFFVLKTAFVSAQYPPAAGQAGTTAIHSDSNIFIGWAATCVIERGPINIQEPGNGQATFGAETYAVGKAEGNSANVVSLGDGGMATLTFPLEIADKDGWDFVVFENSLNDTFLELAFVEASSDGTIFFRFPAVSLTNTENQVGTFGEVDCTKINNLAGKYRQGFGTPFDFAELDGTPGLDLQHITHIRVIDAVGCVQSPFATNDSQGNVVNDPWPTPFDSGGFDLDGVGVIHGSSAGIENSDFSLKINPNPCFDFISISTDFSETAMLELISVSGKILLHTHFINEDQIDLSGFPQGLYILKISSSEKIRIVKVLKSGN